MPASGFEYKVSRNSLRVYHHGRLATTLRGKEAQRIGDKLSQLDEAGQQGLLARVTGNYKRGNER